MHGRHFPSACSMEPIVSGLPETGSRGTRLSNVTLSNDSSHCISKVPPVAAARSDRGDSDTFGSACGAGTSGRKIASECEIIRTSCGSGGRGWAGYAVTLEDDDEDPREIGALEALGGEKTPEENARLGSR